MTTTTHQTTLDVTGMSCSACVRHVTAALRGLDGVVAVDVQLEPGTARVAHDPARAPVAGLLAALAQAGYAGAVHGSSTNG
jgi:copper chaperone CopZ